MMNPVTHPRLLSLNPASNYEAEVIQWLWPNAMATGYLSLLAGDIGVGKSLLALDLAARISRGTAFPDGPQIEPGSVIVLEAEDSAGMVRTRLEQQGADLARVLIPEIHIGETPGHFDLGKDLAALDHETPENTRLLIISPINSYLPEGRKSNLETDVRSVLLPLTQWIDGVARRYRSGTGRRLR